MMKKNTLYRLCAFVFLSVFLFGSSYSEIRANFSDVATENPYYQAIEYVKNKGIVQGYIDGTYRPNQILNRAEFTKIIIESRFSKEDIASCLAKNTQPNWTYVFFTDVPKEEWFSSYVCMARVNNIINGYPDGTFRPSQGISLVEAAKIIVSAFEYEISEDTQTWFKPYIIQLENMQAIPVSIQTFEENINRGHLAEMMYRILEKNSSKSSKTYASLNGNGEDLPAVEQMVNEPFSDQGISEGSGKNAIMLVMEEIKSLDFTYSAKLFDVSGFNGSGEVKTVFTGGMFYLYGTFENLEEPQNEDFFEGWLVRKSPFDFISTGRVDKIDGVFTNIFSVSQDYSDYTEFVLTIEPNDGDPAPAQHVLEGELQPIEDEELEPITD